MTNIRWEKYVKKYVWNGNQTPFFVPVGKLTVEQAKNELSFFAIFLATPFALFAAATLSQIESNVVLYLPVAAYSASIVVAAILVRFRPRPSTVAYCATAPVAVLLALAFNGFSDKLGVADYAAIIIVNLAWLRYTYRVFAIAWTRPRGST